MPTGATMSPQQTGNRTDNNGKNQQQMPTVPFIRASMLHTEEMGVDITRTLTGSTQDVGVHDVTAYGYVRHIVIKVTGTGAVHTTDGATFSEDGPFNLLSDISLSEPNGATIVQFNNGYELFLANKFGGYFYGNDPRRLMTTDADGNFSFTLRIPVEISGRDGLGALPNQNAASAFKVRFKLAPSTNLYETVPDDTLPSVNVKLYLEAYDQPAASSGSAPNQTTPPALNTTQYWSVQSYNVNSGEQRIRLDRVGNYIRNLLFVFYDTSGSSRSGGASAWPQDLRFQLDTVPVENVDKDLWALRQYERYAYAGTADTAGAPEAGVYPYDFCHEFDGQVGHENRDLWLPTLTSSRLEIQGNFNSAGTLYVLTNDISTAGAVFM